ncbi:MAG: NADH/ubiquinone/plastoquinone (complex I), partial [Candidatus Marinimicrobia bacterium]|nr:NADH/ubiquinone/plastoquinone (complex I) [Candidatus Neomarinimicrobiota bacterium]
LRKMGRLSKLMPVTAATSMIGTLSVSGLPVFNGFFSKLLIILAAIQAGATTSAIIAVVGSILTLAYFLKFQRYGFLGNEEPQPTGTQISTGMKAAMITLAVLCVLTSILIIPGIKENILTPVVNDIINKAAYIRLVLGG